jgi:cytochrome c biogenesis protein CcmG/thiol:disulfide interchange protein DsbE
MGGKVFLRSLSLVFILLVSLAFTAEGREDDLFSRIRINPIKGDKRVPDFSLKDLTGKKVEIKQYKGKIIFLNFWATWCGPCKEEMPSLEVLHRQFKGDNFVLLTISVDYEGLKPVREFLDKQHYTFPVLLDPNGETLDLFEVKGIPITFIIDKRGRVIGRAIGPRDWKSPEVFSLINILIQK